MNTTYQERNYGSFRQRKPQPRRVKIAPVPAKPCVVRYLPLDRLMDWKPGVKQLMLMGDGSYFEFPSKRAAHNAIWHTVQASGAAMSHVDYSVEEV